MTINVSTPGGANIAFPDGTDSDTISRVMAQAHGGDATPTSPQAPSDSAPSEDTGGGISGAVGAVLAHPEAALSPTALAAVAARGFASKGGAIDAGARGATQSATLGLSDEAEAGFKAAMRKAKGDYKHIGDIYDEELKAARAANEQASSNHPVAYTAGELAGGAALPVTDVAAGTGLLARAGIRAAEGAGYGAAIGAGEGEGVEGREQGALGGGIVGGVAGGVLGPLLDRGAPAGTTPRNELLQRAQDLTAQTGVDVPIPRAMASDSRLVNAAAGGVGSTLLGGPLQKSSENLRGGLSDAASAVADALSPGASGQPYSGGSAAKEGLLDWVSGPNGLKSENAEDYTALDKLINPKTIVPLTNTARVVKSMAAKDLESASSDGQKVIGLVQEAVDRGGLTYQGLKDLRTSIGQRVNGDIAPENGVSAQLLDKMYGALSDDLTFGVGRAGAKKGGVKAATDAFNLATANARTRFGVRDALATIVGKQGDAAPERVFDRIVQIAGGKGGADLEKLSLARDKIGDAKWGEVSSAAARQLGRDATGNFSAAKYMTDYKKMSDQGKGILFGAPGAAHRDALDNIYKIAERYQQTIGRFSNTSLTGNAVATVGALGTALVNPLLALAHVAGGLGTSWLLSRPVTAKAAAGWMRAYVSHAAHPGKAAAVVLGQQAQKLGAAIMQEGGQ